MNTGIYILKTAGPDGPEYRVAYSDNIESIWVNFNTQTMRFDSSPKAIKEIFGSALVGKSATGAKAFAMTMPESRKYLTDGIFTITELENFTFKELTDGC